MTTCAHERGRTAESAGLALFWQVNRTTGEEYQSMVASSFAQRNLLCVNGKLWEKMKHA